jgi:hypothetical protein
MDCQREQFFRLRYEGAVDGCGAQAVMLGQRFMPEPHQLRAAGRQRLARHQQRSGSVTERQTGGANRHVLDRLDVTADVVTHQLTGADQRRPQFVMQSEIPGHDVQRLDQPSTRAGDVEGVQRRGTEAPGDFGRRRRLERLTGDSAVDHQVDVGCVNTVLPQAGGRGPGLELAGQQREIRLDIANLGVASVEDVSDALLD